MHFFVFLDSLEVEALQKSEFVSVSEKKSEKVNEKSEYFFHALVISGKFVGGNW